MNRKQRTTAALVLLFAVAGTSYAFLEWQARPALFEVAEVGTTTSPSTATTTPDAAPDAVPPTSSEHAFGTVTLKLNEVATFPNGFAFRPISVVEDSRCPAGVMCIQAGTVRVSMRVQSGLGTSVDNIGIGKSITTEAEEITLVAVEPVKRSGTQLEDRDYRFTFEVKLREGTTPKQCFVGGCSAQLCTDDPNMASTCEYRAEYACYKTAECKRQDNGQCGWTETDELKSCLRHPPELE